MLTIAQIQTHFGEHYYVTASTENPGWFEVIPGMDAWGSKLTAFDVVAAAFRPGPFQEIKIAVNYMRDGKYFDRPVLLVR